MSHEQKPTITLLLSSVGFKGSDLDNLIPDFETDYETIVGITWFRCVTGPETWTLTIVAAIPIGAFLKKYAELLAADIYAWSKSSLKKFFSDKPHHHGSLVIQLDDITLYSDQPLEVLSSVVLVDLLSSIDPLIATAWQITYDKKTNSLALSPETEASESAV